MQIPILNGIYSDDTPNLRTEYPKNLTPVPKENGISKGYLKPADGIIQFNLGTCPGIDRGGYVWGGAHYRVLGSKLCLISSNGAISILGDVGTDNLPVSMAGSFDKLAVASNRGLFYWDKINLNHVTNNNLGLVLDVIWMDGYFITTDGNHIVVTNIADPYTVNNLAYGSPINEWSSIKALLKFREELYCIKRYSISVYDNVGNPTGTSFFPFQVNNGALILRGCIATHACKIFNNEFIAFVGCGENEPISVFLAMSGESTKIATREIDSIIQSYTNDQLLTVVLDCRIDKGHQLIYIHLPDRTLVYDAAATQVTGEFIWFVLSSDVYGYSKYQARFLVWAYDKWVSGDPTQARLGYYSDNVSHHYGLPVAWEFGTTIIYNSTNGVIIHELELVVMSGHYSNDTKSIVYTSHSTDLETWSREYPRSAGKIGNRNIRLNWLQQGNMQTFRIQKFRGTSDAHLAIIALEARIEPLND